MEFTMTIVYGPIDYSKKDEFFAELCVVWPIPGSRWLALGDFNQIYHARDKNNKNINISHLNRSRSTLEDCDLKEIHLQNGRFIWSNERENPTMSKLDSFFGNNDCDVSF